MFKYIINDKGDRITFLSDFAVDLVSEGASNDKKI
jgi:hypothetical protein